MIDKGQWREFGQDTGVIPLLFTMSVMGFLMTTESPQFFLSWSEQKWQLLLNCSDDILQWKLLFGSYFQDVESVNTKCSIHTGAVTDSHTLDSSVLEPVHNPCKEDNSANSCNCRFSNRDGDKEAKLTDCSFKFTIYKFTIRALNCRAPFYITIRLQLITKPKLRFNDIFI